MARKILINIDSKLYSDLQKRASKNYSTVQELIEEIIRKSMLSYRSRKAIISGKTDDRLVNIFSRSRRGRKKKKEVS